MYDKIMFKFSLVLQLRLKKCLTYCMLRVSDLNWKIMNFIFNKLLVSAS